VGQLVANCRAYGRLHIISMGGLVLRLLSEKAFEVSLTIGIATR
jgi:hypothetical protein